MAIETAILVYRGEQAVLNFAMDPSHTPISGWTLMFTVARRANSTLKLIGPVACTILNATTGTYRVTLTEEQTDLSPADYFWDVWRTDEGFEQVLGLGTFTISADARVPPL